MSAIEKIEFRGVYSVEQRTYFCSSSEALAEQYKQYCGGCATTALRTREEKIPMCMLAGYIGAIPELEDRANLQASFRDRLQCVERDDNWKLLQADASALLELLCKSAGKAELQAARVQSLLSLLTQAKLEAQQRAADINAQHMVGEATEASPLYTSTLAVAGTIYTACGAGGGAQDSCMQAHTAMRLTEDVLGRLAKGRTVPATEFSPQMQAVQGAIYKASTAENVVPLDFGKLKTTEAKKTWREVSTLARYHSWRNKTAFELVICLLSCIFRC